MKKNVKKVIRIASLILLLTAVISNYAFAEGVQEENGYDKIADVKISIGYDSFLYKAKLFFEDIRMTNAFTKAGKANVAGIFAKRRIAEADMMIQKGDLNAGQELMISAQKMTALATENITQAVMKKDNGRIRLVLSNVNDVQSMVLNYYVNTEALYPETFDTKQMIADVKESIADVMVLWAYLSYKESFFADAGIRQSVFTALEEAQNADGTFDLDAISSATMKALQEEIPMPTEVGIDTVTGATPDIVPTPGVALDAGTDAISSATQDAGGAIPSGDTASSGDGTVDATSSATIVAEPAPVPDTSSGGGGVDATSGATPPVSGGSAGGTTGTQSPSYDDDEHEEHEHEDEHEDDEHEDEDDD